MVFGFDKKFQVGDVIRAGQHGIRVLHVPNIGDITEFSFRIMRNATLEEWRNHLRSEGMSEEQIARNERGAEYLGRTNFYEIHAD